MSEPLPPSADRPASSPPPPARGGASRLLTGLVLVLLAGTIGFMAMTFWERRGAEPGPSEAVRSVPRDWLPASLPSAKDLDFRLPTLDGRELGPADFRGQVVVVDFWATWCLPCHLQAKVLETAHAEYAGRGVQVLALDVGETEETVRTFLAGKPYPFPVLLDPEDTVSSRFGVQVLPTLLVLDREGRVVYLRAGIVDARTLREVLKAAGA